MMDDGDSQSLLKHFNGILRNWNVIPLLYAVTELRIAEHLVDGSKTTTQLAQLTHTNEQALYRVLRALATLGVFSENDTYQFELTPLANLLLENVEGSMRQQVLWRGSPMLWKSWGETLHTLKTGETAFNHVFGTDFFAYLDEHPADKTVFNNAMTHMTTQECQAVVEAYDFSVYKSLIDIAGGHGSLITEILAHNPNLQGALFDLPNVVEGAHARLENTGLAERCSVIGGSFFESIPSGYDAYILKDIIHDWDDEQALAILANCRKAMYETAHLLLVERVILPGNDMHEGKWVDITMLMLVGGMERTEEQYRDLLASAGFTLDEIIPTNVGHSVIRALPT